MKKISGKRFDEIAAKIRSLNIAVLGDVMLDKYVWGRVTRISPEAPVPIITLEGESSNLGGAANVCANVGALGANARLFGLIGNDSDGRVLREQVRARGYSDEGIIVDDDRQTSIKTRVIAQNQHIVRIDKETVRNIDSSAALKLLGRFGKDLNHIDAVILQDYNKGVLSPFIIRQVIDACNENNIPVAVDPKLENFWEYKGTTLFKPNVEELEAALGTPIHNDKELEKAGRTVFEKMEVEFLLITCGSKGMTLFEKEKITHIPTKTFRVHDVSGAGDTVIATIMTAFAAGADINESSVLATYAAGVVIAEVGAVPVDLDDLRRACVGRK